MMSNVLWFDMPHYKGRSDVFHLMSVLSPLDHDLAVVYLPLMPVRLVELLESRGINFVHVPDQEFDTMGCNVLALGPRHAMSVDGNPETVKRMQVGRRESRSHQRLRHLPQRRRRPHLHDAAPGARLIRTGL